MEDEKLIAYIDQLESKGPKRKRGGLGSSLKTKKNAKIRNDGLPNNALYANFVREGDSGYVNFEDDDEDKPEEEPKEFGIIDSFNKRKDSMAEDSKKSKKSKNKSKGKGKGKDKGKSKGKQRSRSASNRRGRSKSPTGKGKGKQRQRAGTPQQDFRKVRFAAV